MNKKMIRSVFQKKYYGIITAVSTGLFVIIALTCVCGLCLIKMDIPDGALFAVTCFILGIGGYAAGVCFGRNKRRKGIISGLKCGLWLWGIISLFGIIYTKDIIFSSILKNFAFVCIPAIVGGIYGVNSKIRHPPY